MHRAIVALLLAATLLAGCTAPSAPPASAKPPASAAGVTPTAAAPSAATAPAAVGGGAPPRESIKHGYVAILPGAPNFIAQERGYFADQGIDVDWTVFDSGALMVQPTAAGQLDVMVGVPGPSFFNALARDITLKIVADQSRAPLGLMLRRELADTIRTLPDLRGRRVSFNVEGAPVDYVLRVALQRNGLTLEDVDVQRVVNTDLAAALVNGSVDAGTVPEPLPVLIEARGAGVRFPNFMEQVGGVPSSSFLVVGPSLLNRPDAVNARFLVAYMRGVRDYLGSLRDGKVADPAVLEIMSKWTSIPAEVIAQAPAHVTDRDGRVDLEDLTRQQDFWAREGSVTARVDLSRVLEYKYLDAALPQLR